MHMLLVPLRLERMWTQYRSFGDEQGEYGQLGMRRSKYPRADAITYGARVVPLCQYPTIVLNKDPLAASPNVKDGPLCFPRWPTNPSLYQFSLACTVTKVAFREVGRQVSKKGFFKQGGGICRMVEPDVGSGCC